MGMLIMEDSMEHVPGTTRYFDDPERPQVASAESIGLKCDTSGPQPIILVPQPSDDPNDPLNWPLWKRDVVLLVLSLVSIFATCLGPILAANTLTLSLHFALPFTEIALLTGYYLLGVGFAGIFYIPTARIWGKRHEFLLGTVILIISSALGGAATSYRGLLWARIWQGIGTAPFEALVNATVGDLYFVHERGKRMALTNLAVFGGSFFTPILVGKITHTIGWRWSFYFVAIFIGACLPLVIFLLPETAYNRPEHLNTDLASTDDVHLFNLKPGHELEQVLRGPKTIETIITSNSNLVQPGSQSSKKNRNYSPRNANGDRNGNANAPRPSYKSTLLPFSGRYSKENFFKLLLRPFPLFFQPAIFWACLIQGTLIGWTVFIGIILAAIFLGPPLFWDEVKTGYAYTGAFIGAILGFLIAGLLADWSAKWMTRRNKGVYEPEFRILLVIPQLVFGCAGLYGFGITANNPVHYGWFWPIFFFGLEVMGMVIGAVASALYIVDAHRDIAIEAFTCLLIFKNFFSFGLTWSAYDWLVQNGVYSTFMIISSIQVGMRCACVDKYATRGREA
ncbi:major facilitator superfamily transporter protein [Rutstroemia sp. NJR-2017a BBW]|nr:major facilitator superfamily transporter protein [Rutstroemia sp. NJR-2017a BBW]PQE08603.1 major facilitator superfamily transporter protein [Rutstroemia sp. NJR-2017a BBW]